jgi:hypothetical protein
VSLKAGGKKGVGCAAVAGFYALSWENAGVGAHSHYTYSAALYSFRMWVFHLCIHVGYPV